MPTPRSESAIIASIQRTFGRKASRELIVGIGDDAAIVRVGPNRLWAISTDAFLEGNHFLTRWHSPEDVGYKALARSASDLAAVGAAPRFFAMNLALPRTFAGSWLAGFLRGISGAARRFGIVLIGGDTTRPLRLPAFSANLMVIGELAGYPPLLRSGARPGDILFLSGTAGAAQLGLELLRKGLGRRRQMRTLLRQHLRPEPRLALGAWLARHRLATAMLDTSDGLSCDLRNLCAASGVGAQVRWDDLPLVQVPDALRRLKLNVREMAVHGGDDYELLFTVAPRNLKRVPQQFKGVPLTPIGRITRKKTILIEEGGHSSRLRPRGWDPFR